MADKTPPRETKRLVDINAELLKANPNLRPHSDAEKIAQEEVLLLKGVGGNAAALLSAREVAQDVRFTESMPSSWRPSPRLRRLSQKAAARVRRRRRIDVAGEDPPPPATSFADLRFPRAIYRVLQRKGIVTPTPIQVQGLPAALSGRDTLGVAFTGSGKTIVFALPMVMQALEAELRLPLARGEGPVALMVCPSRELCAQTHAVVAEFTAELARDGYPALRTLLLTGGLDMRGQNAIFYSGPHMVCATPGRLLDLLDRGRLSLELCALVCLDEADRLLSPGFEEDVRNIFGHFRRQRQTLLFSATMPPAVQRFASAALARPVAVTVGRAGAACLDVVQEVEYAKGDAKMPRLLAALRKTAPPVLVFCGRQADVDDVHEYLLLKGVRAAAVHGGKAQDERAEAVRQFKAGERDVLVATDVASKGLDFPAVQHVVNFEMPGEIEDYVHRVGRTGRCGNTGVATTFFNRETPETVLLDLKHLLREARQKVPPELLAVDDPSERYLRVGGVDGCAYCGGLGHRITHCPKLEGDQKSRGGRR